MKLEIQSRVTRVAEWLVVLVVASAIGCGNGQDGSRAVSKAVTSELRNQNASETGRDVEKASNASETAEYKYPIGLSRYDFQTRDDLYYAHLVERSLDPDNLASSTLVKGVVAQLGTYFGDAIEANNIANIVTSSFQIKGHAQFDNTLTHLVNDCARILCMNPPETFIQPTPELNAYVVGIHDDYQLVLTKGLLDLYAGRPEELRFIIGHELGHIKCNHMRHMAVSYALFSVFQSIENRALGDNALQGVLPTLAMGRLLKWSREAEFSADRAGLICCQDPDVAFDALNNLLSGLRPDSPWRDERYPSFDEELVIRNFRDWENTPIVSFFIELQRWSATHPFIPDRLAALKAWGKSESFHAMLRREADPDVCIDLSFTSVGVEGLPEGSDPYIVAYDMSGRKIGSTPAQADKQNAFWKNLNWLDAPTDTGNPIFFEIWDENYSALPDALLGIFAVFPNHHELVYRSSILWDVDERTGISLNGRGSVRFLQKE